MSFFDGISGESVRAFIIFLLVNSDVATINSQKNNKIIELLPRICLSKNDISEVTTPSGLPLTVCQSG